MTKFFVIPGSNQESIKTVILYPPNRRVMGFRNKFGMTNNRQNKIAVILNLVLMNIRIVSGFPWDPDWVGMTRKHHPEFSSGSHWDADPPYRRAGLTRNLYNCHSLPSESEGGFNQESIKFLTAFFYVWGGIDKKIFVETRHGVSLHKIKPFLFYLY